MSIYVGNDKIDKFYVGSTEIAKVYKGSDLLWENGLKLYAYRNISTSGSVTTTVLYFNVGGIGTNFPVVKQFNTSGINQITYSKFTAISGNLGSSGSKITINGNQYTYKKSATVNGFTFYVYTYYDGSLIPYTWAWVLKGTAVNQSKVIVDTLNLEDCTSIQYPYSANSSQLKLNSDASAADRYSDADITWK